MFSILNRIAIISLLSALCGCIPAVVEVYEAPLIYGQVLDAKGLKPIVGAKVLHQHLDAKPVYTDAQGYFELPSISSYQAVMLMPAHALTSYHYSVTIGEQELSLSAQGSLRMLDEELAYTPILVDGNDFNQGFSGVLPGTIYDNTMQAIRQSIIHSHCDTQQLREDLLQVAQQHSRPEEERDSTVYLSARKGWELCSTALNYAPLDHSDQWAIDDFTRLLAQWQWRNQ